MLYSVYNSDFGQTVCILYSFFRYISNYKLLYPSYNMEIWRSGFIPYSELKYYPLYPTPSTGLQPMYFEG